MPRPLTALRCSGAAFIKWGQWSSTREDVFPDEFCRVLSELHDAAPTHSLRLARRTVEAAFGGRTLEQLFLSFEPRPVASGSIAQVGGWVLQGAGGGRDDIGLLRQ